MMRSNCSKCEGEPSPELKKLERVTCYVLRPATSDKRLKLGRIDEVLYDLKRPYSDGTIHLSFTPLELMARLKALVPPPRKHLIIYHGCLATNAKIRSQVVRGKRVQESQECKGQAEATSKGLSDNREDPAPGKPKHKRVFWAKLLMRIFKIDMSCPICKTELKPVAAILKTKAIFKILTHLNESAKPREFAPAQFTESLEYVLD